MSTIAVRMHDLRVFGRCAFGFDDASRTIALVLESLQHGIARVDELARAWDAEQRANGLAWQTRSRRRKTLRSFVAFAESKNAIPRGVSLDVLPRDTPPRGSIVTLADDAIRDAIDRTRWRDAAILALAWEIGATLAAIQNLRIGDLPIAGSDRCALALSCVAGDRPATAYVFAGNDASKPIDAETIRGVLARYGLPGTLPLRRARTRHLRLLDIEPNDTHAPRVLAGEV